uniref:FlgN family protein n=1 Tax=Solibacter usitatus (strain Ellin6076) TaxID=234267 RepID=Q01QL5_SOLUE
MPAATVVEQLAAARLELDRAGELLTSPSPASLDRCSSLLEATGRRLAEWQPRLAEHSGDPEALAEAWRLRRSFRRTERLLQGAGEFHSNWVSRRGAMTGGYTSAGDPAPVLHGHRISLQG